MKPRRRGPWKAFKHLLAYVLLRTIWGTLSLLPERGLYALGTVIGALLACTPLLKAAQRNIELAYGADPPSPEYPTSEALARACLRHYGWLLAEMVLLNRWQPRLLEHTEADPALLQAGRNAIAKGRGVVLATGHISNWEMLGRAIAAHGFKVCSMAKAAFDPRAAQWLVRWRAKGGVTVINRGTPESVRALRSQLSSGAGLGVLVDVDTRVKSVWVPFFGTLAKTPTAAADLALKLDAPLLVAWGWRIAPGRFAGTAVEVKVERTGDREADVTRITAEVTRILEQAIRAHPEQWIWTHRRWRSRPPTEVGPAKAASHLPAPPPPL